MQPTEVATMTILDGELFDTEIVTSELRGLDFFANARCFTDAKSGTKIYPKHTNLVGHGSHLPRAHSLVATALRVEFDLENMNKADRAKVCKSELLLRLGGGGEVVERIKIYKALMPSGAALTAPRTLDEMAYFSVSWVTAESDLKKPLWERGPLLEGLTAPFEIKVSLLGAFNVPVFDDESRKRAREHYAQKKPEMPRLYMFVHADCAKDSDRLGRGPMTRRTWETEEARKFDMRVAKGLASGAKRRNPRQAWYCHRCDEKVKQSDMIVSVETH